MPKFNQRLGVSHFHLQDRKVSQARNHDEADSKLGFAFGPKYGSNKILRNVGWLSTNYTALYPKKTGLLYLVSSV
jgi:hypothetical protein